MLIISLQRQEAGAAIEEEEEEEEGSQPASQRTAGPVRALVPPLQLPQLEAPQQQEQAAPFRPSATRRLGAQDRQDESGDKPVFGRRELHLQGGKCMQSRGGAMQHFCAVAPQPAETSSLCSSQWEDCGAAAPPTSLAPLLVALSKAGTAWADRVALFQSVQGALQQSGATQAAAADVASNADRLMAALLDGCSDAHFRVAGAALAALGEGLAGPCSRIFEPQLDRIMTTLFARWVWGSECARIRFAFMSQ